MRTAVARGGPLDGNEYQVKAPRILCASLNENPSPYAKPFIKHIYILLRGEYFYLGRR